MTTIVFSTLLPSSVVRSTPQPPIAYHGADQDLTLVSQSTPITTSGQAWTRTTGNGSDSWQVVAEPALLATVLAALAPTDAALAELQEQARVTPRWLAAEPVSVPLDALEALARVCNRDEFARVISDADWTRAPSTALSRAIDLALSLDLTMQAAALARIGATRFPDDARLVQAVRVLTPPVVRTVRSERSGGLNAAQEWLRDHADAYRGQWVVVREGQLLGSAPALADLRELIARENDPTTTIITRVG